MTLNELSRQFVDWITKGDGGLYEGIYTFQITDKDKYLFDYFIEDILSILNLNVYRETYKEDLSHCKEIKNSIFIDDIKQLTLTNVGIINGVTRDIEILGALQRRNNNIQIIYSRSYALGGYKLIYDSNIITNISNGQLVILKNRFADSNLGVNLAQLIRDEKLKELLLR